MTNLDLDSPTKGELKLRIERGDGILHTTEIQSIKEIPINNDVLHKPDNLKEIDKFLEAYNTPTLNDGELENLNRPITRKKMESIIKNLLTNRSPRSEGFITKFYQTFKE